MNIHQYTIGRGDECQIRIQDPSQRVSRNHATIKVLSNGKIFIFDHSTNGTFVNGIKISKDVDYPIKRGDSISFANVTELNWDLIPKQINKLSLYLVIVVIIIILGLVVGKIIINNHKIVDPIIPVLEKESEREQFVKDSIQEAKYDSLLKAKNAKDEQLRKTKKLLKEKELKEEEEKIAKELEEAKEAENARKAKEIEKKDTIIIM